MKQIIMMVVAAMMATMSAQAQKMKIVDAKGQGIPLVSVLTEDGVFIGTTDLNGTLADVKGAKKVSVTHVAYKPQLVTVASLTDGCVTLEDIDYGLDEIVVKPKPYIYVETYYRVYVYRNDSLGFFHCGIMPNAVDYKAKKQEAGSYNQNFVEYYSSMGVAINWGARLMELKAGQVRSVGALTKNLLDKYYLTADESDPNCVVYSNPEGQVGQLVRVGHQLHTTLDAGKMQMYVNKAKGETALLKKREEREYEYQYTLVGNYKENGEKADVTDFIMNTEHWEYTDKKGHAKFIIECYATERGYMDKNDWKDKKKELKEEFKKAKTLEDMVAYEQKHNIPALPASVRQAVSKLKN